METSAATATPFLEVVGNRLRRHFHRGQERAWDSPRRFVCVLAGTQGGKTSFGPHWLWREIQARGAGDYLVATPTFPLLELKALPEFKYVFEELLQLGEYAGSPIRRFTFSAEGEQRTFGSAQPVRTRVYFGHANDPDSLEAATAKAAWLDEAGQKKFRLASWEAVLRRLAVHRGRVLITTTPYNLGWLKQQVYDRWKAGDSDYDVIRFDSTENPAFPQEEFERARNSLPLWKFNLFYRAIFSRPAGLIYDCFDETKHKVKRFAVSPTWERYLGLDFGGVNTAGVFFAQEPGTGKLYAYREYKAGSRTACEHKDALLSGEQRSPLAVGGSKSESQWRDEFAAAGLGVQEPVVSEVEVGIDRVYGAIKRGELCVFEDLPGLLEELATYSRVTDEAGNVTEKIEDKETYHYLDACRYIVSWLKRGGAAFEIGLPARKNVTAAAPRGVFHDAGEAPSPW